MSNPSRDYYLSSRSNPSRQPNQSQTLPPLRSVLGDELALPAPNRIGSPSYHMRDASRAPPARSGSGTSPQVQSRSVPSGLFRPQLANHRDSRAPSGNFPPYAGQSESASRGGYGQHSAGGRDSHGHPSRGYDPVPSGYYPPEPSSRTGGDHGNKRYGCTWPGCDKRFERKHALDTHMNIHTEAKPFACPVARCGKVFNVRSNMRRHLLTHREYQTDGVIGADDDDDNDGYPHPGYGYSGHSSSRVSSGEHRQSSSSAYYSSSRRP
ncbi:hypothetical protein BU17DRAFT_65781 [Hysterangium stoloniferum]|nr:hypothetical protein BU17DRAFT_65781 [Hysterangium stoloniferum]